MNFLMGFVNTLGLDKTFFIQFIFVASLFFILNKFLFSPYLNLLKKQESLTKGKFSEGKGLEDATQVLKEKHAVKSRKIYAEFQSLLSEIKKQEETKAQKEQISLKESQGLFLKTKRDEILKSAEQAHKDLQQMAPSFAEDLLKKIKGSVSS